MKKYVIVVETGCDPTPEQIKKYGIYTVPMHVFFGEDLRDDGTFHPQEEFDFYKKTGTLPKSCGSNVEDFDAVFDRIHAEYPQAHILHIGYSAQTTVSFQSGVLSAENRDYVTNHDSLQCTGGAALVAVLTSKYIDAHPDAGLDEVSEKIEHYAKNINMCFLPGDLDYLRAGGRVSNAAYIGAKLLNIKPLIEVKDGVLMATKKYRGSMNKIAKKVLKDMDDTYNYDRERMHFLYSYGLDDEIVKELTDMAHAMGFKEVDWNMTGGTISCHCGPGSFGVAGLSKT